MQMLLECEPVDFATLVREAAERSAQFSAKLVEQVLEARHAVFRLHTSNILHSICQEKL